MSLINTLSNAASTMSIDLTDVQCEKMLLFLKLVEKWNQKHNLTAIHSRPEMIVKHLLDSLSIQPYLKGQTLLDAGCGAGLPGIPLAITMPELSIHLMDASHKRIVFVKQVKRELKLDNITAEHSRVENSNRTPCDMISSRAFTSLNAFVESTRHLLKPEGFWLAMKGVYPQEEIDQLNDAVEVTAVHRLEVAGLSAERHLVCLKKKISAATSDSAGDKE